MNHVDYMMRCIQLAQKGRGWVNPNPMVGALIVHNGVIVSEGFHEAYGHAHAEPNAIYSLKDSHLLQQSTLYVSLEPCAHFGKTPPCANLIVESKIPRVVVAMRDPNPLVAGKGIEILKKAGIEVTEGICEQEALALNRFFICFHQKKRPYIIAKWAETQNGFMAPLPKSEAFISGNDTRVHTHALRQEVSAVLVGVGTWEIDNPQLNDRIHGGPQPIRVVVDSEYTGSYNRAIDDDLVTWVLTDSVAEQNGKLQVFALPGFKNDPQILMDFFYKHQINSLLVEGGATTLYYFLNAGYVDEIHQFQHRDLLWENGIEGPKTFGFKLKEKLDFEHSVLNLYEPEH
jgi:diaminohydroxyphosphoribosylaminopyrimidine deaminase/5-amino-6-(5-phosphoribosylamino)uracil reductase